MPRTKPVVRAIKLLSLIENNSSGLRVSDMAEQLGANPRAVYRDLQVLQELPVPLYTERDGKESYWKIDPDLRKRLSIPFTLSGTSLGLFCPRRSSPPGRNRAS